MAQQEHSMHLTQLLAELPQATLCGDAAVEVSGLAYDSRQVEPGFLFVAIRGAHVDGHGYIPAALSRGAVTVVAEAGRPLDLPVPLVQVPDPHAALADLAATFYGHPARDLLVVGVTGTDGKTTTCFFCSSVLEAAGHTTALLGTVDFKLGPRRWANKSRQTSPESLEVQSFLRQAVEAGCTAAVLESSSHGLALHRLEHCEYDVAVLTNVTHEHLELHGTVEAYRLAKARLFEMLSEARKAGTQHAAPLQLGRGVGVVNLDDPNAPLYSERTPGPLWTYAIHDASARVRARDIVPGPTGLAFTAVTPVGEIPVRLRVAGTFNVYNALAAACVGLAVGATPEAIAQGLADMPGVTGRMQRVDEGQPFHVLVDYAHTPESFETVIGLLRPAVRGRMIAVFGSAGERDCEKRPMQGEIAARYCEVLVITDEDPRREDRQAILDEIAAGAERLGKVRGRDYLCIADRREAIRTALEQARPDDMVLLLGKGHEGCIFYAGHALPWDEAGVAHELLREMGYGRREQRGERGERRAEREAGGVRREEGNGRSKAGGGKLSERGASQQKGPARRTMGG
jgi:UDP-N-acetylmuramoyl-L-alanyl-D-glutamate--2,6-diaminopimelate ligase